MGCTDPKLQSVHIEKPRKIFIKNVLPLKIKGKTGRKSVIK